MGSESSTPKDAMLVIATSGVTTLNVFLNGGLTVALPTIGKDLRFREAHEYFKITSDLQWPLAAYALSYGCLLLFFGRVGDIVGGRVMFILGSMWFSIWSLATAFAPNDVTFIVFVALQGLGAAANTPAGIRILILHFEPGPRRNKAFGVLGAGQPIGYIFGLVVGGLLTDSPATWRGIFYIQAGLGVLFVALGWVALGKERIGTQYTKGLDWGGAALSTVGVGLLTYSLADSTASHKGWAAPQIPSLLSVSLVILACFLYYERWREAKGLSVLMPLSMWRQPGAKMGSLVSLVFFAWFSFNTLNYFMTLYFQQVILLNPLHTAIYFIPATISGFIVNLTTGYVMNRIPGQFLILVGLTGSIVAPLIFALIDTHSSYWTMAFFVLILVVGADAVYPVGNLHVCSAFDEDSQALAGGVFNVATRIGTSIGLAVTSSIATGLSKRYQTQHPVFAPDAPAVLMVGFRAAGWTCLAAAAISFVIGLAGLRDMGMVGKQNKVDGQGLQEVTPKAEVMLETITQARDVEIVRRDREIVSGVASLSTTTAS